MAEGRSKRSLWLRGLSILIGLMMLSGVTGAWLSYTTTTGANTIRMGSILVDVIAFDLLRDKDDPDIILGDINNGNTFVFDDQSPHFKHDLRTDTRPIISEDLWEPGVYSAKLVKIINNGTNTARVKVFFYPEDKGLGESLWFDLVPVVYDSSGKIISTRELAFKSIDALNNTLQTMPPFTLPFGASLQYALVYKMGSCAGNSYQNKSFSAGIIVESVQDKDEAAQDIWGTNP